MPTFNTLKNLISPDSTTEPAAEPTDTESVQASKKRYRPTIPYGYKDEPGLEQPWYSPDALLAGAIAPEALTAGTAVIKTAPRILGNEGGWLGKEAAQSILAKKLGLKEGDDLISQGLQKVLENPRTSTGLTRQSLNPEMSANDIIRKRMGDIKTVGGQVQNLNPNDFQKFIQANKLDPATQGVFSPTNKSLYLKTPNEDTINDYLTTLLHESKHLQEHALNPEAASGLPNYGTSHPLQQEALEKLGLKGANLRQLSDEYFGALQGADPERAAQLSQAYKAGHWVDPKMLDYEAQPAMNYLRSKSASTLEPHEFEVLKNLFPLKK